MTNHTSISKKDVVHQSHTDCLVLLVDYIKLKDNKIEAIVDFRTNKDLEHFNQSFDFPYVTVTAIALKYFSSSKRLRRGSYYILNLDLLKQYPFLPTQNSYLIGGAFNLSEMAIPNNNEGDVLQWHHGFDPSEMTMESVPSSPPSSIERTDDLQLFVNSVGQANWNELRNGAKVEVVYDAGAPLYASKKYVDSIFDDRKSDLIQSRPILILSHWDLDHIHCLKKLTDTDIRDCFSALICVDKVKSITSKTILENFFRALGKLNVYCLPIPLKTNGVNMHLWQNLGCVSLYQGEQNRSINFCGLVMFVRGGNKSANYTGDCKLSQADNVFCQEPYSKKNSSKHILIAPHHGGNFQPEDRHYSGLCDRIVISVGINPYGHPCEIMLNYFHGLGPTVRTDEVGDILELL